MTIFPLVERGFALPAGFFLAFFPDFSGPFLADVGEDVIKDIRNRLGSHLKAAADLPRRSDKLADKRAEVFDVLRGLNRPASMQELDGLSVPKAVQVRIRALANSRSGLCRYSCRRGRWR